MKGYIIGRANIVDQQKSENYKPLAAAANKKFGGKYLARCGRFITKEGIKSVSYTHLTLPTTPYV